MKQNVDLETGTGSTRIVRTVCDRCHCECGVLVQVRDGKAIKVEGDPNHPINEGSMCAKGLAVLQEVYHPDRNTYPMKRTGQRGEGKWQRISWDEALDTVAAKFKEVMEKYGPESITWSWGDASYHCHWLTKQGWLYIVALGYSIVGPGPPLPIVEHPLNSVNPLPHVPKLFLCKLHAGNSVNCLGRVWPPSTTASSLGIAHGTTNLRYISHSCLPYIGSIKG